MQPVQVPYFNLGLNFWPYYFFFFFLEAVFFAVGTGEKFKRLGIIHKSSKSREENLRRLEKVANTIFGFYVRVYITHT